LNFRTPYLEQERCQEKRDFLPPPLPFPGKRIQPKRQIPGIRLDIEELLGHLIRFAGMIKSSSRS
jgi:hypothetical protein